MRGGTIRAGDVMELGGPDRRFVGRLPCKAPGSLNTRGGSSVSKFSGCFRDFRKWMESFAAARSMAVVDSDADEE